MARIKKYSPEQKLSSFQTFLVDDNPNSDYFRITEFKDTFTGGKNGFLIEGSEYLKETTEIKIEILDVDGNPIYYEPGKGVPEYYEGISSLIAVYVYNDTPIGLGKITILGELKEYIDNDVTRAIPETWKGTYNVKWERTFQVNKLLANEDRVRFVKRPEITIDEINKPIFNNNANLVTQIGNVNGIPLTPTAGTSLSEFSLPTTYRLNVSNGSNWTGSIEGNVISFDGISYTPTVLDVVSETEVIVSPPYAPNGIVASFSDESYTTSFNYIEGVSDLATALTGSFAKISITDMKTAVGDAARVKVYRRSQSNLTDFEFVQEIQLESNELLRDIETTEANEISYGTFTEDVLSQYWMTSSNDISVELNTGFLYNSAKLNSTEGNHFLTTQTLPIKSGVEYTLDFNVKKGSNVTDDFIKATISGSLNGTSKSQTIVNIPSSNSVLQKQNFVENIIADEFDEAKLYFEVEGSDWYINNVSLKASQETSFSPDEITFIQQVPKTLQTETFDYRFEFYDINNNYIPVLVEDTKTFDGGNLNLFNKDITLTPNNLYFQFDSASAPANPLPPTTITFDVETTLVTGSITYTSGAYDEFGDLISSSEYVGGQYPGVLSGYETLSPTLTVADFTGSRDDITVQYIRFTGEVEGVSDDVVITRTQDGKGGVNFEIRPYRGTIIKNKDDKTLEVQAIRIDGVNEIILRDNLPQTGFSDAKLRVQSGSEYILLSEADSTGYILGLSAGTTGSGELDYNAVFDRTSITGQLPLYLMDGDTEEDILSTLLLTDLQDGLGAGFVTFDVEQFNINPKEETTFTPQTASLAGNFYLRGTNESPISGTLKVFPSMSIASNLLPEYYMFFETGAFDSRITVTATNAQNEIIGSGIPGDSVDYYTPINSKQLTFNFTYTEDFTSESISVDKTIFTAPDGIGIEPVVISVDPITVNLNSNQQGEVYDYTPLDTTITAKQGPIDLIYTASEEPGTFFVELVTPTNITYLSESFTNTSAEYVSWSLMDSGSLIANVDYDFKVYPYYTSSFESKTIRQRITKGIDGSDAIEIEVNPSVVSLQANENGTVSDYSTADTDIVVKQGNLYLSYETSSLPGTYTVSATGSGIVVGNVSASSQYDLDFGDETVHYTNFSELNGGSGSVDYNFYVYPYSLTNGVAGVEETYSKKQLFSKSNDGTAARNVSLSTTTEVVNFDGDGVVTSPLGSIFLEATAFNVTASQTYYQFFRDGFAYSLVGTDPTFEIGSGDATSPGETATWTVQIRDGQNNSPVVASAEVTIAGIKAGANNYQVSLTNPSPTVGVEVDGTTTLDTTGTQIRAFKGATELTHVSTYSEETLDLIGDPIGTLGEFSASLHYVPTFITQPNLPIGNPASIDPITDWTLPQDNNSATLVYKVDIENGRATYFLSQSISTVFEGATGPGIVVRGEWTGSVDYLFSLEQKRRDAIIYKYDNGGEQETHYFATTNELNDYKRLPYTASVGITDEPEYDGTQEQGDVDTFGWEYLGQQDMFVAAKIAIFEESFVENTINVGIPPDGSPNANIAIVGGTDEPYIAVGQQGTQGYAQPGVFMGMSNDGGPYGTSGTMGLLSLKSTPDGGGSYNSLEWDGETLTIRGGIRQTAAGQIEPSLRGTWSSGVNYYINDSVIYNGQSWSCNTNHTSTAAGTDGPPGTGDNWDSSSGTGKTVSLSADTFVIEYDQDGNNPSPSSINLFASSSNFIDPYFKFTGGGSVFTDETTFTDGNDTNNDSETSIDLSGTTISDLPLQFRVGTADGGLSGQDQTELVSDVINIFGIKPGSDTTPQYMITPTSGGTQIKNNSGNIVLQVQESSVSGLSDISSGNIKLYKDDSSLLNASMSGITGDEYNPTIGPDAINGTLILELRDSSDDSVLDTIALLDVTDGLGGGSFISSNLKSTRTTSTNTFPITNTFVPEVLSTTASFYDTSGTEYTQSVIITPSFDSVDRMAVSAGIGDTTNITITAGDGDGGIVTLGGSNVPTKDVVLTAVFTDPATGQTTTINETFYIISDGADGLDAITVINTNQAHTLAASSDGTVSSYVGSGTTISVYEGVTKLDYDGVGTSAGHFTISTTPTDITVGTISDSGDDALVGDHSTITDTSATIVYNITGQRSDGTSFNAETTQTFTKAIAGTSAKQLSITSDSQIYSFDDVSDTTPDENDITFTISQQNLSTSVGTSDITVTPATTAAFNPSSLSGTVTNGSGQQTFVLSFSGDLSSGKADLPVTISVTNDGITDTTTIYKIEGGSDSDPQYMITPTNGTQIKNGSGTLTLQAQSSDPTNGLQSLSSGDIKIYSGSNLITTYANVTGTDYNPTISADAIIGTMTLRLFDGVDTYDSLTLLDVTDGLGGGSFISPNLKSNRSTFDNSFTPTLLRATASFYDTSGTEYQGRVEITPSFSGGVDRMAVSTKVGDSEVVITAGDGDGGTITLGGASVPTKDTVLTAVFTDPATGQTTTINETFYIVSDGVDGIDALTIILTNESHTLPASSDGTVTSFDGSGTDIYLYEGTASILYDGSGTSNGTFDISTTPTNITVGSISDEGIFARVGNHSNMTEDSASIVYTLTGKRTNGDDISVTKTQSFVKARAGASGSDGTNGQDGEAAGIVYSGQWDITPATFSEPVVYLAEADLKYVVSYVSGVSNYFVCATTHRVRGDYAQPRVVNNDISVGDIFLNTGDSNYYISTQATSGQGVWDSGTTYPQYSIVQHSAIPYVNLSGQVSSGGSNPSVNGDWTVFDITSAGQNLWDVIGTSIAPGTWGAGWESFGAEFTSVATDILFAQDVYANKTVNIGTGDNNNPVIALNADSASGYANPYISIGQDPPGFEEDGIFLGFSQGTASFSLLTEGAKANIGGLNVDKSGLYFYENVVIGTQQNGGTNVESSTYTFPSEVANNGVITIAETDIDIDARVDNNNITIDTAIYAGNEGNWSLSYNSGSFPIPTGGPSTPDTEVYQLASWRFNYTQKNNAAGLETWLVGWSIDRGATYSGLTLNGSEQYAPAQSVVKFDSSLPNEIPQLTDNFVNGLRNGGFLPSTPGGGDVALDVTIRPDIEFCPILYIESQNAGGSDIFFNTGSQFTRVGFWVVDIINSTNATNTTGYDALVLSTATHDNNLLFEDTFEYSRVSVGVDTWADGSSWDSTDPNLSSVWLNAQLAIYQNVSVSNPGGVVNSGFISNVSESIEIVRINSSGSQGNEKPYISIGQPTQSFDVDGIFMGYVGDNPALSIVQETDTKRSYFKYESGSIELSDATFGGTGSVIEGSEIRVGDDGSGSYAFTVSTEGNVFANNVTLSGSINVQDGRVGDWIVEPQSVGGQLRDVSDRLRLDSDGREISLLSGSADGGFTKRVSIKAEDAFTVPGASNPSISAIPNGNGTTYSLFTKPTGIQTNTTNTSIVYGSYQAQTLTSAATTIDTIGTYAISGLYTPIELKVTTPSTTVSSYSEYPQYTPSYAEFNFSHYGYAYRQEHFLEIYLEAVHQTSGTVVRTLLDSVRGNGARSVSGFDWDFINEQWNTRTTNNYASSNTSYGSGDSDSFQQLQNISMNFPETGDWKFRYSHRLYGKSGQKTEKDRFGNLSSPVTYTTTPSVQSGGSYNNIGYTATSGYVIVPQNIIELTGNGVQVLQDSNTYLRMERFDTVSPSFPPNSLEIKGGKIQMYNGNYDTTDTYLAIQGRAQFYSLDVTSPSTSPNTNEYGVNGTLTPKTDNTIDLGRSNFRWDTLYAGTGTINTSDRKAKRNIEVSDLGLDFINSVEPVKYTFIDGNRTHYGLISQQISESLALSNVHTDDFAGFIKNDMYTSGSDDDVVTAQYNDIINNTDELGTLDMWEYSHSDYGLRYNEFISPMIKAIQELTDKVTQLEAQISGSNS